jgi:hypothetical protein
MKRQPVFYFPIVLVASVCLITGACGNTANLQATSNETSIATSTETSIGVTAEVTRDNVHLTISSDKSIYKPGEIIRITATVENITDQSITYTLMNIGDPKIYVFLEETPFAGSQGLVEEDYTEHVTNPMETYETLEPKQIITRRVVWNQQLSTYPDPIQAPSGIYRITSYFLVGKDLGDSQADELSASVDIKIQDAKTVILPEKALEIASIQPEVISWIADHSGASIAKYENGQYFLYDQSGWQKVSPDGVTLEDLQQKFAPHHNVLMANDKWEVRFFTKMGPSPYEIIVRIDSFSGKVLSVEKGK